MTEHLDERVAPAEQRQGRAPAGRPSLSVVIEWENARLSEAGRALRMLDELARQLEAETRDAPRPAEVLVLHNPDAVDRDAIEAMIATVRPRAAWPADVRLRASGGGGYYEQKNAGVRATTGDIVLFLDSDVVPEPGWLRKLLAAFDDPGVGVVCGSTYVELGGFYDRAVALFWLFPLRPRGEGLEEVATFYANNVAFRRPVIAGNPFPALPTFRGQCRALAGTLRAQGVRILRHAGARVSHPPPNGPRHFVARAIAQGHDEALKDRLSGRGPAKRFRKCFKDVWRRTRDATGRIARGYREVGLSPAGAVGAWGLALAYNLCRLAGRLLGTIEPRLARRCLPPA